MEHKISTAVHLKKQKPLETIHWCGTCAFYTEAVANGDDFLWGELCLAGLSYEDLRHCSGNCCRWVEKNGAVTA